MKTYFFFPPGREFWLDIAVWMQAEKIAQPIFWLGDQRHEPSVQSEFPACHFQKGVGELRISGIKGKHSACFSKSSFFLEVKQISEKLMDRLDTTLSFSRVEREGLFYQTLQFAENHILEMRPDFAFFPEAPHSYQTYVFYKVFQHLRIPILEFHSTSIAPTLIPKFSGRIVTPPYTSKPAALIEKAEENILVLAGRAGNGQPDYMLKQAEKEKLSRPPSVWCLRQAKFSVKLLRNGLIEKQAAGISRVKEIYRPFIKSERLNSLSEYLNHHTDVPSCPYVFFPLHYEPERTTCPDGGRYHDQLRALIDLRTSISSDLKIVVKEHPTQLKWTMNGYRGRSIEQYRAIENIANTILVSADVDSEKLIENSVFVASVAGTASLQSALRGKPAIIFGDAWFKDIKNIYDFSEIASLKQQPLFTFEEVQRSLLDFIQKQTICGLHNPSGEGRFQDLVKDAKFISEETQSMRFCLEAFISQECF